MVLFMVLILISVPDNQITTSIPNQFQKISRKGDWIKSELIVENLNYDDEGTYICEVWSVLSKNRSAFTEIHINGSPRESIDVQYEHGTNHVIVEFGKAVTFTALVYSNKMPILTWFDPFGNNLESIEDLYNQYTILKSKKKSSLKIFPVVRVDAGTYTLVATVGSERRSLQFKLDVIEPPFFFGSPTDIYLDFNKTTALNCTAYGYPKPNMSMFYIKCPKFGSDDGCQTIKLVATKISKNSAASITSQATTNIDAFGKLVCTACNIYGCESKNSLINPVDGEPFHAPLEVLVSKKEIFVGDNITLICATLKYRFPLVRWFDDDQKPVLNSDRISLTWSNTTFTQRHILVIKNVQKSDEKQYWCDEEAVTLFAKSYKLIVKDNN